MDLLRGSVKDGKVVELNCSRAFLFLCIIIGKMERITVSLNQGGQKWEQVRNSMRTTVLKVL